MKKLFEVEIFSNVAGRLCRAKPHACRRCKIASDSRSSTQPRDCGHSQNSWRGYSATKTAHGQMPSHRRGLAADGSNPTLLYGYGGFNLAQTPVFQIGRLAWLELGGVLAACADVAAGGRRVLVH